MKNSILLNLAVVLTLGMTVLLPSSCQKENENPFPPPIDSIYSLFPKQFILTNKSDDPAATGVVFSIKYDTTNGTIGIYLDDTTNTNPYDQLKAEYKYNSSGFLVNYKAVEQGVSVNSSTISRGIDNKIIWIAYEDQDIKDTTFFHYEISGNQTEILNEVKRWVPQQPVFTDSLFFIYDGNFKLTFFYQQSLDRLMGLEYNTNNSLKKTDWQGGNIFGETNFFYTSGLTDGTGDLLCRVILGKDYYLQNLRSLYIFSLFHFPDEINNPSFTDPFHLTRMQDIQNDNGQIFTEDRVFTYELDDKKRLTKYTAAILGEPEDLLINFRY